jgi:predicted nucleic acid-binding protein
VLQVKNQKEKSQIILLKNLEINDIQIVISSQVINEFIYVCLKKEYLPIENVINFINGLFQLGISLVTEKTILKALELMQDNNYSYWDNLMIASAIENNCSVLYSEDMHHNYKIGDLTIINPFRKENLSGYKHRPKTKKERQKILNETRFASKF